MTKPLSFRIHGGRKANRLRHRRRKTGEDFEKLVGVTSLKYVKLKMCDRHTDKAGRYMESVRFLIKANAGTGAAGRRRFFRIAERNSRRRFRSRGGCRNQLQMTPRQKQGLYLSARGPAQSEPLRRSRRCVLSGSS
ncbi:hypothetical protein EVAR_81523_1 [Eumeta japonica]|uniref:Uncharacterized protein n=1 Tax=Eumeta variegata TaxID=151549 RepID=A0A4C1W3S6_EUMVA|nr:hypothetical protein EVAR_81523_1 [Eumeta japonica]